MRLIDEQYTRTPFYGIRKMGWWLGEQGYAVNAKRVRRLMRQMGLEALYPKPRLSVPGSGHKIYPYRLRSLKIDRPDHVWASDIRTDLSRSACRSRAQTTASSLGQKPRL